MTLIQNPVVDSQRQAQDRLDDVTAYALKLLELNAVCRQARQMYFQQIFDDELWKNERIPETLTGAASEADADSRRWTQYFGHIFRRAMTIARQSSDAMLVPEDEDVPTKTELYEWFWLFTYRSRYANDCKALPERRSHVRPIRKLLSRCRTQAEEDSAFKTLMTDMAQDDVAVPVTQARLVEFTTRLLPKQPKLETAQHHWKDLEAAPPRRSKAEAALDELRRVSYRQSIPADVRKAIATVIRTFADDRRLIVMVDADDRIEALLCRNRVLGSSWMRARERGYKRKRSGIIGRPSGSDKRITITLADEMLENAWTDEPFTAELIAGAADYAVFRQRVIDVLATVGGGDGDAYEMLMEPHPLVFASEQAAEHFLAEPPKALMDRSLRSVSLVSVQRFLHNGCDPVGALLDDVVDEVFETVELMTNEGADDDDDEEVVPEQPAPNLGKAQQLLAEAKARMHAAEKRWEEVKPA